MITCYPFQLSAVEKTVEHARKGARIIIICSPTGSGKSTIGAEFVRRSVSKDKHSLFVVHRRRLVDQFSERLFDFGIDHGVFMRGHRREKECKVQVASRDTLLSRSIRNEWVGLPPADLIIVDEGRHAASPEFQKLLDNYPKAIILLLDATPVLPDGRGLGPWAQEIVIAAKVTDLIRDGYLVTVKCYAPDKKLTRGGKIRRGCSGDLVESWKEFAEDMPTVLFCSRVHHSQDAVKAFNDAGIRAAHVDANTPDDIRDEVFHDIEEGKTKVVSNVGIIKEGVDVPCLGCVQFFMDPPGRVGFLQGCGRIMRPFPGKTHGVLIDHAGAVFRHGFPDEDTDWTLTGNADEDFAAKHDKGLTAQAFYCKFCELIFHGTECCPECGRKPSKPPKSIFAPLPQESENGILVEADRNGDKSVYDRKEKEKHWFRCLGVAANSRGTFGKASSIYKHKYNEWPPEDFPCNPGWKGSKQLVADVYPNFVRKKKHAK